MKRLIQIWVVGLASLLLLAGCGLSDGTSSRRAIESTDPAVSAAEPTSSTEPASSAEPTGAATIEPQACFTYEGLTVTATGLSDGIFGQELNLQIDNQSKSDYLIGCEAVIVNNYMVTDLFSSTVAAGKQANTELNLLGSELEEAGIRQIGQIELYFYVSDPDTYRRVYESECVTIRTSQYDAMSDVTASGTELCNANGVRISGQYVDENSIWGTSVLLLVENNSGRNIAVTADDLSVNGKMMTALYSATVYDGKKSLDNITLLSTELKKNGIETVNDVELKFNIYDPESYQTIAETGALTFHVAS